MNIIATGVVWFALFLIALFGATTHAATHTAASCSRNDVNTAVSNAANGDTVQIPAGSCTWSSGITVTGKGITITGTGTPSNSPATMGASASCTQTSITVQSGTGALFTIRPQYGNATSRLSCMRIVNAGSGSYSNPIIVTGTCAAGGCPNFRFDNITVPGSWSQASMSNQMFLAVANVFGVADHNSVGDTPPVGAYINFANIHHGQWKGVGGWGDYSYATPSTFGTEQAFYLENNLIKYALGTDSDVYGEHGGGGRHVCRFNTFNIHQFGMCGVHGTDTTGRPRSGRHWEVYYNTGTCDPPNCGNVGPGRGGTGYILSNTVTGTGATGVAYLDPQRTWRLNDTFGYCDGTSPWDTKSGGQPVVCMDQPGRGMGVYISGVSPTPVGPVNQILEPVYAAGNTLPSGSSTITTGTSIIIRNRDYYVENLNQAAQTSATSPFNGTTTIGMGHGSLALRPTTCTTGVGYWATDDGNWNQSGVGGQGRLYVCTAPNTWTLQYMPYTYPHPLIGGGGGSATGPPDGVPNGLVVR